MQLSKIIFAGALYALVSVGAHAQTSAATGNTAVSSAQAWTSGEVVRIEKDSRIIIKHGDIKNLNMGATTSSFVPKDKAMSAQLRPGVTIQFKATQENGKLTISDWTPPM